jgi:DNA-binding NarL/FixJ family response regulator
MLLELRKADGVPQRAKDRAEVIRLSSQGWKVKKIATYFHWRESTVRAALQRVIKSVDFRGRQAPQNQDK